MCQEAHFIGIGDFGNLVAIELTRLESKISHEISHQKQAEMPWLLKIHSVSSHEMIHEACEDSFVIIVGLVQDRLWKGARNEVRAGHPYFTWSIGGESQIPPGPRSCYPFSDDILTIVDPSLVDAKEVAQMVWFFLITHTLWETNPFGSLIAYTLACTKRIFSGQAISFLKMKSNREHYRQSFTALIEEKKTEIYKANGVLMSLWGKDDVLSLHQASELINEIQKMVNSESQLGVTYHILPEGMPDFMATFFLTS